MASPVSMATTDAMFGMAYACSEDLIQETEPAYIQALGWTAEIEGENGVGWDTFIRAFELERRDRAEYADASYRGARVQGREFHSRSPEVGEPHQRGAAH